MVFLNNKESIRYLKCRLLPIVLNAVLLVSVGCDDKLLDLKEISSSTISGTIAGYSSSSSLSVPSAKSHSFNKSSDVSRFSCASPQASLYKLDDSGNREEPALASTQINSDGSYTFSVKSSSVKFRASKPDQALIVVVSGCTSGVYMRPITGPKNQTISMGSTAISYLLNTNNKDKITSVLKNDSDNLVSLISALESAASLDEAYDLLANINPAESIWTSC